MKPRRKIVFGLTGASGAPYAKRCLDHLRALSAGGEIELAVCASSAAREVWSLECGGDLREELSDFMWGEKDFRAPFASGSAGWHAMVIAPCSMGTLSRVAHGMSDTLLTRAADVMLKERRTLVVVPRETPLSLIHLESMTALTRAGATILPAMPSFYSRPESVQDLIDTVAARILEHLGVEVPFARPWGGSR